MKIKRLNRQWGFVASMLLVVFLLGLIHYYDTGKGARESGELWLNRRYLLLFFFVLANVAVFGYFLLVRRWKRWERLFLLFGISFGFFYSLVLPPLSAPDEVSHYISAYKLSNQMMGKPAVQQHGLVYIRAEDAFIENMYGQDNVIPEADPDDLTVLGQKLDLETYVMIYQKGFWGDVSQDVVVSNQWTVKTTPAAYLPQAMGITMARLLNMTGVGLLFMARWFNMGFYTIMVFLAIRRIPFGKAVLFGTAMLPMVLHLSSSMSYDTMILALSFYLTACCLDLAFEKERVGWQDVLTLAVLIGVLSPCKMVYAVMLGFCLLIPPGKFGGWRPYFLSALAVFVSFLIGMVMVNYQTVTYYAAETDSYIEWAGQAGYSFAYLIHNPRVIFHMIYETLLWQSQGYHLNMVGQSLGNMDPVLNVPYPVVMGLSVSLLVLALRKPGEMIQISGLARGWIFLVSAAGTAAILFSMLLAWTPMNSKVIEGVQGRYFLPFLPMLLLSLKNDRIVLTKSLDREILFGICGANAYVLLRLFSIVSMRL